MKKMIIEIPNDCDVQIVRKGEEKEPVIRTYQDLYDNAIMINGYYISNDSNIRETERSATKENYNISATEKVAKSMLAMAMISQLMPYYGGAITDEEWDRLNTSVKYVIENINNKIDIDYTTCRYNFLAFHTPEQRDEFIKYNEQLIKDYLMIN